MTISYPCLLAGLLLLLAFPAYLLYSLERELLAKWAVAAFRMMAQMGLLAVCVWLLYRFESPWLTFLWLLLMSAVSAWTVVRRAGLGRKLMVLPVALGTLLAVLVVYAILMFALKPAPFLSARWLVPVAGVLMAHLTATNIRSLSAFYTILKSDPQPYFTLAGNGMAHFRSLLPYVRPALRALVLPTIANLSVMGLLAFPLLFSGLLLGSASPVESVIVSVLLVIGSVCASVASLILTLILADRFLFDSWGNIQARQEGVDVSQTA